MTQSNKSINQYIFTALQLDDLPNTLLNRTILLNQKRSAQTKIALMRYDKDFYKRLTKMEEKWDINLKSYFINMYDFLRTYYGSDASRRRNDILEQEDFKGKDGVLNLIPNHINKEEYTRINEYDHLGYMIRSKVIENSIVKYEYFYGQAGYCFLFKEYKLDSEQKDRAVKIHLFDKEGNGKIEFESEECLWHHFLDILIGDNNTLITADNIEQYFLIDDYYNKNVYKAYFINNYDEGYNEDNNNIVGMEWGAYPEMFNIPDAIVFSTESQLKDVIKHYGKRNNLFHLPIFSNEKVIGEFSNISSPYPNNIVLTLGNNDVVELELLVRAFRIVADKIKNAVITIYGISLIKEEIRQLIEALNLDDNIIISNKDWNINQVYKKSVGSVFIKKSEGNNLEMIRSLKSGCPVITNDFNYETKEIVKDGENGFLIKRNSVTSLGNRIIQLLETRDLTKMRQKAIQSTEKFNSNAFLELWDSLLSNLITNGESRNFVTDMKVHLDRVQWTEQKKLLVKSTIELSGKANHHTKPGINLGLANRKTNKSIRIEGKTIQINHLMYEFISYIDFPFIDLSQNIWDLTLCLEWNNTFFKKRVGHFKYDIELKPNIINSRMVTPYFTTAGKNLSYKVGKYITNQDKIMKLESELTIL